jgi:hypothetical protein
MDGVAAVRSVLLADADLIALTPIERVIAGPLPLNAALPSLSLQSVSKVDRNIPAPGATRHVRERVQATVSASNYPQQKAILRAVRHAAADKLNHAVAGLQGVMIHTESAGPDFINEEASIWLGTQDFLVTYLEQR